MAVLVVEAVSPASMELMSRWLRPETRWLSMRWRPATLTTVASEAMRSIMVPRTIWAAIVRTAMTPSATM